MRTYLFRGKLKQVDEWVEGFLICEESNDGDQLVEIISQDNNGFAEYDSWGDLVANEVFPETVGQFSGLYDSTQFDALGNNEKRRWLSRHTVEEWLGKPIFEGDILESRASEQPEDWKYWVCIYQDGSFCFESETGKRKKKYEQNLLCEDEIKFYELVVVGNIFDNADLLKKNMK